MRRILATVDTQLFAAIAGLTLFGLIMMSSISIAGSYDVTGQNDFYFWRHFRYIIIGAVAMFIGMVLPYEKLRSLSFLGYIAGIGLLIAVLFVGSNFDTAAKSWLYIGGFSLQPVEIMKLAMIVFLSALFSNGKLRVDTIEGGLAPFIVVMGIPAILILLQPDFGSFFVLVTAASAIYFAAGANLRHAGILGGGLVGILGVGMLTHDYIRNRIMVFLNPSLDPLHTGFQVKQAQIAIGSGGVFGRGFQQSIQKFDYLPEVQSDTIFAAIAEEMGFIRILLFLGVYLYIAWRGYHVANAAPNMFTKLLAVGITTWVVGQAFINIAVNLALFPNTGITLPLISYGGTSMIMTLAGLGILLHISAHMVQNNRTKRWL